MSVWWFHGTYYWRFLLLDLPWCGNLSKSLAWPGVWVGQFDCNKKKRVGYNGCGRKMWSRKVDITITPNKLLLFIKNCCGFFLNEWVWHSLFKRHPCTSHPNSELCIMLQNYLAPLSYVLHRCGVYSSLPPHQAHWEGGSSGAAPWNPWVSRQINKQKAVFLITIH